jgi:hypothetical protein
MHLAFHMLMITVYEKYNDRQSGTCKTAGIKGTRIKQDTNREPLALCAAARVKSIRIEWAVNHEPLAFCMWCCACKKYKGRMGCQLGAPCFLYVTMHV